MVKFKAGDLIEQCLPVAYALDTNDAGQRCDFCFCTMERPRVCLDCKSVFYCSKDCMKDDKRLAHKFGECDLLKTCPRMATDTQQLVLRLYLKCKAKPKLLEDKRTLFDGRKRSLADLMHHEDNIRECQGRMKLYDEMVAMLEDKVLDNVNDNNLLFRLYCQVLINSFAILDPEKRSKFTRVGAVLYIEGSAYDHSCEPNSIQWFIGTKLQIKALRDFDTKTEPVLIHYIDLKLPLDERRCKLLKQYYFKCECSRCITEAMGMRTIDYDSMYQLEEEARKITREFACTDKLTVDKLSAIKWALEFHRVRMKLLPLYEKSYGKNHPYVKHVIQNISDLKTKLEKIDDGMKTIIDDDKSMISNVSEFKEIESPST